MSFGAIFFITKMHHRTISLTNSDSHHRNKENMAQALKLVPRPAGFQQNITIRPKLTEDISKGIQEIDQDSMARFKDTILKERSANIKAYHLKIKDQDDMIKEMRSKVAENKNIDQSLISSRYTTLGETEPAQEATNISKKLSVLQKNMCSSKYLPRRSFRTEYLLTRTQSTSDASKNLILTPVQQLCVAKLPTKYSEKILNVDGNIKKLLEIMRNEQKQHRNLRDQCSKGQQIIDEVSEILSELAAQKSKEAKQQRKAYERYSKLQNSIHQKIEIERKKYLMISTGFLQ